MVRHALTCREFLPEKYHGGSALAKFQARRGPFVSIGHLVALEVLERLSSCLSLQRLSYCLCPFWPMCHDGLRPSYRTLSRPLPPPPP